MNRMTGSQRDTIADQLEQIAREGPDGLQLDAALDAIAETLLPNEISRYFEAHITYVDDEDPENNWENFCEMCREFDWKPSKFEHDEVDGSAGKWFMSARDTSYLRLRHNLMGMVHALSCNGTVDRYKIEETLLDSKCGDQI